jgi:hypothetical protein
LLGKSILNGDILSLNSPKLAQLLPECIDENRHARGSAYFQKTYAEDFSRLLRRRGTAKRKEHSAKRNVESALADD